jgi:glycine hydroxymethyltransferase
MNYIDNEIWHLIECENKRQDDCINLIASENICPEEIRSLQGSILTNKYAEGTSCARYYAGCEYVDIIEQLAQSRCLDLFNAHKDYIVSVQPHSGTQANHAAYIALLKKGDVILSMDFASGGHLSHGHRLSIVSQLYDIHTYTVDPLTYMLDYDVIQKIAYQVRPRLIIAGASSYSRVIDYQKMADIAESVGAYLLADIAHIAGIIAAGLHPSPIGYADIITSTTQKTLRGSRGGFIIAKKEHEILINRAVMPGVQGGPFMHAIAAKAATFLYAQKYEFREYQKNVLENAAFMADMFIKSNIPVISGGTDNHLFVINTMTYNKTGAEIEGKLEKKGIIVNKNGIPFDLLSPRVTSGIRIGTPFVTSQGKSKEELKTICEKIIEIIKN